MTYCPICLENIRQKKTIGELVDLSQYCPGYDLPPWWEAIRLHEGSREGIQPVPHTIPIWARDTLQGATSEYLRAERDAEAMRAISRFEAQNDIGIRRASPFNRPSVVAVPTGLSHDMAYSDEPVMPHTSSAQWEALAQRGREFRSYLDGQTWRLPTGERRHSGNVPVEGP